ncbi:MAG: exodeoxyribonuclease VII small subunit [Tissierellia bacterium]|nr:exodeoxyribonuclease VII small subunit [Bacillota bacterium]NLL23527.1 exodeoxyribonuclease VII small subunit [Tissierellia bacterium]
MNYNEKLKRLEDIRLQLEAGGDLEDSILLYEESLKLYRELRVELKKMEDRFEELSRSLEEEDVT